MTTANKTVDAARVERLLNELRLPGIKLMWARIKSGVAECHTQLPKLILGVKFADGIEVVARKVVPQPETAAA
jgi:hypothetical protein